MTAIPLDEFEPELRERLEALSKKEGLSLAQTVRKVLAEALGVVRPSEPIFHDLDHLAGTWDEDEAREFDLALAEQRRIHPDDWR